MKVNIKRIFHYLFFTTLFLPVSAILNAGSPLITINDKVYIFLTSEAQFLAYDNLFYQENDEVDDTLFVLTPGFEANLGKPQNRFFLSLSASEELKEYTENSDLDTNNTIAELKGHYKSPILKTEASLRFRETDQLTADLAEEIAEGDLVERDLVNFESYAEYELSAKTSLGAGLDFAKIRYVSDQFVALRDRRSISVPVDFYYELTPKLDISVGYRHRQTNVDRSSIDTTQNRDTEDNFFNVGFRGELTPKLSGTVQLGFQDRNRKNDDDETSFSFISDLTWKMTEKTHLSGQFIRDFDTGGQGDSIEKTSFLLDLKYFYSPQWVGKVFAQYEFSDYNNNIDREDDFFQTGFVLSYIVDQFTTLSGGVTYQDNDSDDTSPTTDNSFDNTVISLSLLFRY